MKNQKQKKSQIPLKKACPVCGEDAFLVMIHRRREAKFKDD